jgi:hypothetical protein
MDDRRLERQISAFDLTAPSRMAASSPAAFEAWTSPKGDLLVALASAARPSRAFIESRAPAGPVERIALTALPARPGQAAREYRAALPSIAAPDCEYVPVAVFGGEELRGDPFRIRDLRSAGPELMRGAQPPEQARAARSVDGADTLDLIAHVEADLPDMTVFGPTPEGIRIAFYIRSGAWSGPKVHARYKSEGGDWILVRKDGVGIPNARATLETSDGALLFYQLTGTIDLGQDGYARVLANDLPEVAPLSVVAQVSTSVSAWRWLNRLTLVGTGIVHLKSGRVAYDLFALRCPPALLPTHVR